MDETIRNALEFYKGYLEDTEEEPEEIARAEALLAAEMCRYCDQYRDVCGHEKMEKDYRL